MSDYYVNSNHVLVGPNVIYKPLPQVVSQSKIVPYSIILHTNSSSSGKNRWQNLWNFLASNRAGGVESHFQIDMDGTIIQFMPCNVRADCNYKANSFVQNFRTVGAISIETQDNGEATLDKTPWTLPQIAAINNVVAAVGHKYGVPYVQPATWDSAGVGYHSLFKEWSIYKGKVCPGAARIAQMDYVRSEAAKICVCEQ